MDEAGWRSVAKGSDLAEGALTVVDAGEEKILLVRINGTVHAVGHKCPHYEEKLEKGALFGTEIVCKSHFARMDVTTGRVIAPPAYNDLPVYPVKEEDGEVWVGAVVKPKFPKPAADAGIRSARLRHRRGGRGREHRGRDAPPRGIRRAGSS